ncbi:hypothetical protein RB195_003081 [Necator americanus]|uniref:Sema domain-containing protein n=1 Tax=Necator americanus TaxID=51031 RepID=A0ABR1DM57_NECAM
MRKTVDQCPVDIVPAPSGRLLTDLEYGDDAVIFAARNLNMSTLYRSSLQPMDYVYALINADKTSRPPCTASSGKFVELKLGEATWPKTEDMDRGGERGPVDARRG